MIDEQDDRKLRTFCNAGEEVLVVKFGRTFPQSDHTGLYTNRLQLSTVELVRTPGKLLVIHVGRDCHLSRMNLEDTSAGSLIGKWEFDLSVQSS